MTTTPTSATTSTRKADGFTLPEVLITMVVMGIIVSVLTGVASVVFRNTPTTETRAEDARSVQGLVTWLPQDVDSTPPSGFDTSVPRNSGCGTSPGTNILHLTWTEDVGSGDVTYIANYRHAARGTGFSLIRITCSGFGAPPYTNGFTQNLTGGLPDLPAGWTPGSAPVDVDITLDPVTFEVSLVTFELTTESGDIVRTDSAPKNPAATLPTTTLPSWYIPTPTTGVYTNTPPVAANDTIQAYPSPAVRTHNVTATDADGDSLVVEIDPSSVPAGWIVTLFSLTLNIEPLSSAAGTTETLVYTVDDGNDVVSGSVTVEVIGTATPTTTTTTTTTIPASTTTTATPPCAVTSTGLSRNNIKNVQSDGTPGQVTVGVLFKAITVFATTNDYCTGMEIRYSTGGVNSPGFLNLTQTGPNSWEGTLLGRDEGSSESWADGFHPISFHSSSGGPWATISPGLEVT